MSQALKVATLIQFLSWVILHFHESGKVGKILEQDWLKVRPRVHHVPTDLRSIRSGHRHRRREGRHGRHRRSRSLRIPPPSGIRRQKGARLSPQGKILKNIQGFLVK